MSDDGLVKRLRGTIPSIYDALDAAVKAQGMTAGWINRAVDDAYAEGRADALEEAATVAVRSASFEASYDYEDEVARRIAAAIRALKEK